MRKLEAAGIEPASRCISGKASTCVVGHLNLALPDADRQASGSASSTVVSPHRGRAARSGQPSNRRLTAQKASAARRAALVRLPLRSWSCQLKVVAGCLTRPTDILGTPHLPSSCPVETSSPPDDPADPCVRLDCSPGASQRKAGIANAAADGRVHGAGPGWAAGR